MSFAGLMQEIKEKYNAATGMMLLQMKRAKRIVADHVRTATCVFLINDGVVPSNVDRGYILRRLLRRAIFQINRNTKNADLSELVFLIVEQYKDTYPELEKNQENIVKVIKEEQNKFLKTIEQGEKEFNKITPSTWFDSATLRSPQATQENSLGAGNSQISGKDAFILFSSYGFPFELTKELAEEKGLSVNEEEYKKEFEAHQALSRMGAGEKFKGGLADTSDVSVRYHTATHLLHQALFEVLGERVEQKGSNINTERMRFDFAHSAKMTAEEIQKVEDIVNSKINLAIPVQHVSLPKEEALKIHGVRHLFLDNYGDNVTVYYVGDNLENAYSKEFCGGPHVTNTKEIGKFKIIKEEAVSTGIRRIKAVIN
jgi:alanyl-tRNA synthetase